MAGASIEATLELWASSLRDVKARMRSLFTQERVVASAGQLLDGLLGEERRKTGWMRAEAAGDPTGWSATIPATPMSPLLSLGLSPSMPRHLASHRASILILPTLGLEWRRCRHSLLIHIRPEIKLATATVTASLNRRQGGLRIPATITATISLGLRLCAIEALRANRFTYC